MILTTTVHAHGSYKPSYTWGASPSAEKSDCPSPTSRKARSVAPFQMRLFASQPLGPGPRGATAGAENWWFHGDSQQISGFTPQLGGYPINPDG
jgi:hypothetical protein